MAQVVEADLDAFRRSFPGQVITAPGADYDSARSLWNGCFDQRPAAIARCFSSADVAAAVAFARQQDLEISVRGGGHSVSGVSATEGSLMIDLSRLREVVVDPAARRARCGGGATGADLDAACQQHRLAVTTGTISHIGVAGLTLGGGVGWLRGMMGLSMDNLTAAEVVLADGRCVRASEDDHPDLFWALRGGGGNFGVVTNFEYQLQPVGPEVHVGLFFWDLERSVEALRLCREAVADLPRDASSMIAAGLSAPAAPFVPEQYHFTPGIALIIVGFSSAEQHKRLIDPIRAALPPLFEYVTPMPYTALQHMLDGGFPWGIHAYAESLFLNDLSNEAIDVLAEQLPGKRSPMSFVPIFPLGGAYRDIEDSATAFSRRNEISCPLGPIVEHVTCDDVNFSGLVVPFRLLSGSREARFSLDPAAVAPSPELLSADRAWVRALRDKLLPNANKSAAYVNFISEYDDQRIRNAYGPTKYDRLARIKAEYDPENVFHLNANIKPAPTGTAPADRGAWRQDGGRHAVSR